MELFYVLDYGSFQPVTTIIMWKGPSSTTVRAHNASLKIKINFILNSY